MTPPLAVVLYEDSGDERNGPHRLLLSCVADRVGVEHGQLLGRFGGIYASGSGNVLRACREDLPDLAETWPRVAAVFDLDQLHRLFDVPRGTCKRDFIDRIRSEANGHAALRVVFLVDNMETVEDAARDILGRPARGQKKRLNQRDAVMNDLADAQRAKRDELLERVPSFRRLVDLLISLWQDAHPTA